MWDMFGMGGPMCTNRVVSVSLGPHPPPGHLHALGAFHTQGLLWVFSWSALCS